MIDATRPTPEITDGRNLMSKKAPTTKKATASPKELTKALAETRSRLTRAESRLVKAQGKAERWKKEAVSQREAAATSGARAKKLQKKLDRALAALESGRNTDPSSSAVPEAAPESPAAEPTVPDGAAAPDATWTVLQLRAEARRRGVAGMSNKSKAQLLAALS